jgi:hypothetical protein
MIGVAMLVFQIIAAANGFLLAVLWFDLMFDVQVWRDVGETEVSEERLSSIAAYYHRVTTTATPMGRLVALVMLALIGALIAQAVREDVDVWVSVASFVAAAIGIGLAMARVFGRARRLGWRKDSREAQTVLARSIFRDHIVCLAAMVTLLVVQFVGAA